MVKQELFEICRFSQEIFKKTAVYKHGGNNSKKSVNVVIKKAKLKVKYFIKNQFCYQYIQIYILKRTQKLFYYFWEDIKINGQHKQLENIEF